MESRLLDRLFENRGYGPDYLAEISTVQPEAALLHETELCEELKKLHDSGQRIGFIPDFDMDGIMSGVIGLAGFAQLGFNIALFLPDVKKGYGFDEADIQQFLYQYPDMTAIITADVGITCYAGVREARARGLKVFVTDHHKPDEVLVDADLIVDPMQAEDDYYAPEICGAYVIYKILHRYAQLYCDAYELSRIKRLRVFAAIGTISDMMPVTHENRGLIQDGITITKMLCSGSTPMVQYLDGCDLYRRAFLGLYHTVDAFCDAGKLSDVRKMDADFFGYYMAPMFNSVKRMAADIRMAFGVFFGDTPEANVQSLLVLNEQRKRLVQGYFDRISSEGPDQQPLAPYVYFTDAPAGILGLLAMRLMQVLNAGPCLVLNRNSDGSLQGSGRSPDWFAFLDLFRANLDQFSEAFGGGHNGAFGVYFETEAGMSVFYRWLVETCDCQRAALPEGTLFRPDFVIDLHGQGDVGIDLIEFSEFLEAVDEIKPFGRSLPEPQILLKFRVADGSWKLLGKQQQHVKVSLPCGFEVLLWNHADRVRGLTPDTEVSILGKLGRNEWRDTITLQFVGELI